MKEFCKLHAGAIRWKNDFLMTRDELNNLPYFMLRWEQKLTQSWPEVVNQDVCSNTKDTYQDSTIPTQMWRQHRKVQPS